MYIIDEENEKKEIIKRYKRIFLNWKTPISTEDRWMIRKAFNLAVSAHKDTRRKSGEPYIYHPLEVARIVVDEIGLGKTSVICALLHDVVEDTDYTLADMEQIFGEKVASIIDGLTKMSGYFGPEMLQGDSIDSPSEPISLQKSSFQKMLLSFTEDARVLLIKFADRLHNMRTLDSMPRDKQLKIASETNFLYAPLAHRLGLYAIKTELEDLSFKYLEPEKYHQIESKLKETEAEREAIIKEFTDPIRKMLDQERYSYTIAGRVKSIYSIYTKMQNKGLPFEEIYDIFAIRIVFDITLDPIIEKKACFNIYSIVTSLYKPNPERFRDWVSTPKSNGYEALHTTVMENGKWIEVQIRSKRMDEIAEKGYAAHWKYKGIVENESRTDKWLNELRDALQNPDAVNLDAKDLVARFLTDEIVVFTPKGSQITLPARATVLDFAYAVHTELGNTTIGAKVDYQLVSINHPLKNGEQVEIITSAKQTPTEEWLNYVVTARAKDKIKNFLKEQKRNYRHQGEEILKNLFAELNLEYTPHNVNVLREYLQCATAEDLFYQVCTRKSMPEYLKRVFNIELRRPTFLGIGIPFIRKRVVRGKDEPQKTLTEQLYEQLKNKPESISLGDSDADIKYQTASCCNPLPGDDVVGIVTPKGIEVHRTSCPNAISIMSQHGGRIVKAKWRAEGESVQFLTGLLAKGTDDKGVIHAIVNVISEQRKMNIRSFTLESHEGVFEGKIMLYVTDTKDLDSLIEDLLKIDNVISVIRLTS